jgi:hypothetical protein
MAALNKLYRPGFRYKKAGVILLDLVPAGRVQGSLFDAPDDARSIARMKALDALNARFGRRRTFVAFRPELRGRRSRFSSFGVQ